MSSIFKKIKGLFSKGNFKLISEESKNQFVDKLKTYYKLDSDNPVTEKPELLDDLLFKKFDIDLEKNVLSKEFDSTENLSQAIIDFVFLFYIIVVSPRQADLVSEHLEELIKPLEDTYNMAQGFSKWKKTQEMKKNGKNDAEIDAEIKEAQQLVKESEYIIERYNKLSATKDVWDSLLKPFKKTVNSIKFIDPLKDLQEQTKDLIEGPDAQTQQVEAAAAQLAKRTARKPKRRVQQPQQFTRESKFVLPTSAQPLTLPPGFKEKLNKLLDGSEGQDKLKKLVAKRAGKAVVVTGTMDIPENVPLNYGDKPEYQRYNVFLSKIKMPPAAVWVIFQRENPGVGLETFKGLTPLPGLVSEETEEEKTAREAYEKEQAEYKAIQERLEQRQKDMLASVPSGVNKDVVSAMNAELSEKLAKRFQKGNSFGKRRRRSKSSKKKRRRRRSKSSKKKRRRSTPCQKYLQKKIRKNIKEWKLGRYKSRKQAIAVSYSQTRRKFPRCRSLKKK